MPFCFRRAPSALFSEGRSVLATTVLIVCPDCRGLASLATALSDEFAVLTATDPQQALRLAHRHEPCSLAYCAMERDPAATMALAADLKKIAPALPVIALVHKPCPPALHQAVATGLLQGVYPLPLSPESLQAKTRAMLAPMKRYAGPANILTREEVDFLLQPEAIAPHSSQLDH